MYLGYNTNGLAHHDLLDAVELLAEIGYQGVAITIDHNALSPRDPRRGEQLDRLRRLLERLRMRSVIETGARFLLDPRTKHEPTLLSELAPKRIAFYKYAIDCAAALGSDCVSLWSGVLHGPADRDAAMERLIAGLREVLDDAASKGVQIGFEPEPGMLIDTVQAFEELLGRLSPQAVGRVDDHVGQVVNLPWLGLAQRQVNNLPHATEADRLPGLTLDIGHLQCQGETPIAEVIRRGAARLVNVHLEDMRRGTHEHLMFGEGEIDFPPVLNALAETGYQGGVFVELSRHSHTGPEAARQAFRFLTSPALSLWERGRG
ncbi:MAG: sugar phosphate isomerase/epimerase family protein [Thermoguttaceae bacterium]